MASIKSSDPVKGVSPTGHSGLPFRPNNSDISEISEILEETNDNVRGGGEGEEGRPLALINSTGESIPSINIKTETNFEQPHLNLNTEQGEVDPYYQVLVLSGDLGELGALKNMYGKLERSGIGTARTEFKHSPQVYYGIQGI